MVNDDTKDVTYNYCRIVLSPDALACYYVYVFVLLDDSFCTFAHSDGGSAVRQHVLVQFFKNKLQKKMAT